MVCDAFLRSIPCSVGISHRGLGVVPKNRKTLLSWRLRLDPERAREFANYRFEPLWQIQMLNT